MAKCPIARQLSRRRKDGIKSRCWRVAGSLGIPSSFRLGQARAILGRTRPNSDPNMGGMPSRSAWSGNGSKTSRQSDSSTEHLHRQVLNDRLLIKGLPVTKTLANKREAGLLEIRGSEK